MREPHRRQQVAAVSGNALRERAEYLLIGPIADTAVILVRRDVRCDHNAPWSLEGHAARAQSASSPAEQAVSAGVWHSMQCASGPAM